MAIVAEFSIPADAIPGGRTLASLPGVRIELEHIVPTTDSVLPFFWVFGAEAGEFLDHAASEPEIANLRVLSETDSAVLFEAEWTADAPVIAGIERLQPTILDATGTVDGWEFQVRATSRERLADFQRVFSDEGIPVELRRVSNFSEMVETQRPLTDAQEELLVAAYHEGYFDEPRRATQGDLAERFDVSSRAISNRLRRGLRNVVGSTLVEPDTAEES